MIQFYKLSLLLVYKPFLVIGAAAKIKILGTNLQIPVYDVLNPCWLPFLENANSYEHTNFTVVIATANTKLNEKIFKRF